MLSLFYRMNEMYDSSTLHIIPYFHAPCRLKLRKMTLKFDLLLKKFNHVFYLVMVATRQASLSSDNSFFDCYMYMYVCCPLNFILIIAIRSSHNSDLIFAYSFFDIFDLAQDFVTLNATFMLEIALSFLYRGFDCRI